MFLTPSELVELTGYKRAAAQMRALERMGIGYIPPSGHRKHPLVANVWHGELEKRQPKWDALNA